MSVTMQQFFPNIFYLQLVESADVEPAGMESQLYIIDTILEFGDEIHKSFPAVMKHRVHFWANTYSYTFTE